MDGAEILAEFERLLEQRIPAVVKQEQTREPVYCLHIKSYGLESLDGQHTPTLTLQTEEYRKTVAATHGKNAPHHIYCADEYTFQSGAIDLELDSPAITKLSDDWFSQLPQRKFPCDEDVYPMHDAIKRIAARLNLLDWKQFANVTDDFIVLPHDSSGSVGGDYQGWNDGCIPAAKVALLQSRGYWHKLVANAMLGKMPGKQPVKLP